MKYEEFRIFLRDDCMYETIYKDTECRLILVITELDAFTMVDKAVKEEREACARLCMETDPFYGAMFAEAIRARRKE